MDAAERRRIFRASERVLCGHGPRGTRLQLEQLVTEVDEHDRADMYGAGSRIEAFETEIAQLLGKPAAVFMPSGTMAQPIALRIHADRARCRTVAFHPTCHLELHEQHGYSHLHGLRARLVGERQRLITRADLDAIAEPVAALLLELPQREIGGALPSWDELEHQVAWARAKGIALHLDGARLWETAPHFGRSYAAVAALFDTVYVSFYKILGGIAGAALAGPADVIAEAKVWQRRHGGNLVSMYPFVISAQVGLRDRLGRIAGYHARAVTLARTLTAIPGVRVTPDPPHTNMMHALFPVEAERLLDASAHMAATDGVALYTSARPCDVPGYCRVELTIGDAAASIADTEVSQRTADVLASAGAARPL